LPNESFLGRIELCLGTISPPQLTVTARSIVVQVPIRDAASWASTGEVGIEGRQLTGSTASLRMLIEKDFACLDGTEEQNVDAFPHPLAGTKCYCCPSAPDA
jgi:hypothetical protein